VPDRERIYGIELTDKNEKRYSQASVLTGMYQVYEHSRSLCLCT
jgi:hypothetical protein